MRYCHERKYEEAIKILSSSKYGLCQSLYLDCLLSLDREEEYHKQVKIISANGTCNAELGGVIEHANCIYEKKTLSPFCDKAINYILFDKIKEDLFSSNHFNQLISYIRENKFNTKVQGSLHNGFQTSGNLFELKLPFIKSIEEAITLKIELYKSKFKDSQQGFIKNWPKKYRLGGWLIDTKSGGSLKPHMHEGSWISGSFYLKVPKSSNNEGNIGFNPKGPLYPDKGKIFPEKIINIASRDICIFPSSLFHYTIPFESVEERICFVFDLVPLEH